MPGRAKTLMNAGLTMSRQEGETVLKARGWLSDCDCDFQDSWLGICRWKVFSPGDSIINAGDKNAPVVGIASGTAAVITTLGPPDTPLTHISHAGSWQGYVPLVASRPADNSTVARTRVYAAVAPKLAIEALLMKNPAWWRDMARLSLYYGEVAATIVADLLIRESDRRCAATLLRLANCRSEGDQPSAAPVSQTDLAAIANLSRSSVSALLGKFEQQGLVVRNYNQIEIRNPVALRAVADGENIFGVVR